VKLNRDTEYALICLAEMNNKNEIHSARSLSERCRVPYDLLCKVLQRLSTAGILESVRGPKGGYRLACDPGEITLSAIVSAVHEKQSTVPCLDERACERTESCSIRGGVMRIQSRWDELMSQMSLADFMKTGV
jgi:Rrf2 family protein